MLSKNLSDIHERIAAACERTGRNPDCVTLVCVSKTISAEIISQAAALGEKVFGENRAQELCEKHPLLPDVQWHLIGHLQTNKVRQVVGKATLIHSVDSLHLAQEIDMRAQKAGIVQDILLEVNISGEESKYGLTTEQIPTIIKGIGAMEHLRFRGFMTMAPRYAAPEEIRSIFRSAHNLFLEHQHGGADILSMGMSGDFEIAVEEGATHVRVGSSIFKR